MKKIYIFTLLFLLSSIYLFGQTKFGAEVNGFYGLPSGVFSNSYKSNIGENAAVLYHYMEKIDLMLSVGYINFPFDNGKYNQSLKAINPNFNPVNFNINYRAIPLLIGAKLFIPGKLFKPFVTLEGGVSFLKFQTPNSISAGVVSINDHSSVQITLAAGIGVAYVLLENLNINICAKLNYINEKTGQLPTLGVGNTAYLQLGNSIVSYYSINAGLSFYL